jgi:hypothetical protein
MYAYGYRNLAAAKEALRDLDLYNLPCTNCSTCRVSCTMNFNIKERIEDIARMRYIPEDFLM